ncbi:MAG: hypothetical protein NT121_02345 [Chloroflexi bacterium]|nr:hypothetical protein [Chloroflexota bacterium]
MNTFLLTSRKSETGCLSDGLRVRTRIQVGTDAIFKGDEDIKNVVDSFVLKGLISLDENKRITLTGNGQQSFNMYLNPQGSN